RSSLSENRNYIRRARQATCERWGRPTRLIRRDAAEAPGIRAGVPHHRRESRKSILRHVQVRHLQSRRDRKSADRSAKEQSREPAELAALCIARFEEASCVDARSPHEAHTLDLC